MRGSARDGARAGGPGSAPSERQKCGARHIRVTVTPAMALGLLARSGRPVQAPLIAGPPRSNILFDPFSSPSALLPSSSAPPPPRPARAQMYPISDLTAFCRRTTGDVPPKLVVSHPVPRHRSCAQPSSQGASTTVVGSKMYLYVRPCFLDASRCVLTLTAGRTSGLGAAHGSRHIHVRSRDLPLGQARAAPRRRHTATPLLPQR